MAFDPDAYLAEGGGVKETPFDPDSYLGIEKPVGTSIGQEISQIPAALKQSFVQPLESMGETAQVAGFPAVATALKGAIQEPEGYVSAGQRFMEPQEGEFQVAGFAPQYAPRAVAEQTGQILMSIGSRIAGAVTLGGLGALINPATGVAGLAVGQFAGPALFEAAQIVGPVALERAKNNGYAEPTDEDMAYAIVTATGSGLLNAFGAKYLPGGEKAVGSFSKRLASSFLGQSVPEGLQSFAEQIGGTIETKKGIQVSPKQAVGEALIGGGAGAAATTIAAPFTPEQIAEAKITESANKEAENLFIGNDNPQGKAVLANKQKLEQEIADTKQVLQAIESTDPVAQKLKLELKEKEAILAAAQSQVDNIVESADPVAEAEKQQIELAKTITAPAEPTVKETLPVQPALAAPVAAPVEQVVTPPVEVAPTIAFQETTGDAEIDAKITKTESMSPDEYLQQAWQATGGKLGVSYEEWMASNKLTEADRAKYSQDMKAGDKFPLPYIDKYGGSQDGRNRALAAKEAGIQSIPVGIIEEPSVDVQIKDLREELSSTTSKIGKARIQERINKLETKTPAPVTEQAAPAEAPAPEVAPASAVSETITEPVSVENVVGKKVTDSMGALPQKATKAREALQGYTPIFKIGDFYEFIGEEAGLSGSTVVGTGKSARSSLPYHQVSKLQEIANKTGKPIAIIANTKVAEVITPTAKKPKLGQKGGVLIPTKEDFIQAGQNIYEAGMEFGAWAKQMIQRFGDAVREFLGEVWQAVSGAPAKLNELMGYLPQRGETGAVNIGGGKLGGKTEVVTERAPSGKPEQIMGEEIGPLKTTPEGIIAKTQELLRKKFDPAKVSDNNTTEAFRALGRLTGRGGTDFAKELNDVGRVVDKSGAASEISMGAALFINDLFEYSIRLAAEGNKKLIGMMLTNINKLPTAGIGASDAARDLRARLELAQRFLTMAQAEQDAYTNYVAEFIYGPNPTKDQIQSIKDAYAAVEKTPQVSEQELTDELESVGGRIGTDLVGKINEEFKKATEKGREKRKTEEAELDTEYKKVQRQADAEIEKLAKIQSDTPSFDPAAARQITNDVRAIVANDLKQRPDMGRKAPWKSLLVAKLQEAGVEVAAAETLADIVWRQHEINNLSRELSSINKAIEKGPISEIVKAIKETPLEDQQNPNWRYEVMRDYLRRAGLNVAQSERIAKLMDISLQKRFTMAQEQAFTDAISKTAPWKSGDTRSRRAFQKVLQALRAGALDPARNVLSDMAALNGWTGFTPEQYKDLLKNDAILADPKSGELKKAEAYKAIQDVISKAKLPIRARDVIGQYYDAQALSGIPTLTVNAFSPIAFALRNAIVEIGSGTLKGNPKAITNAATALVDSIKSWANTVAFSFKNNVTVYSNVDYIVNDDNLLRLYRKGVDQFNKGKTPRDKADGVKNMMIGIMDYVRRMLNALDYGAIASLQNQNISKYSMAVMKRQGMSTKEGNEMFAVMMKAKNDFYLQQIAGGMDKNKASILADEFYISSWNEALTKAGVEKSDIKQAMDAAINDALSSVGRNRQSIDALKGEATKLKDAGVSSMPALWLLESMANAANQSDNQIIKLFSRVIYGFAIVPARVIRETAWFSPYGFVRFGYDAIAKKMGRTSPYAQSLGTDVQYSQRLNEAIAGTVALTALFALRAGSTDEPEEDDFKIVFTGNGPQRKDDPQFYDSWYKAGNKPNTMSVYFGKSKFDLNMMRGFEAFTWPAMMLGALDDLEIRKKQKRDANTGTQLEDASIVAGFVFDAALRRGPYAFTTKSLFGTYGDIGVEGVAKGLTFPAKTLIPVLGTSLASNLSNFINDPIDRRTLDGAVWSNIPFIGPVVAPKSLNAFGEPSLSTDMASKMFKLGVPIVYDIPTDRESIKLHELVLKQGGGPSIPTRNQLAQRLDRDPTNKEYEMFAKEYGLFLTTSMKKNYEKLSAMKPEAYTKVVERIGNRARDIAENKVRVAAKKP